ncbi:MAG: uracil-DNA glycosylase [Coprobacillus sp.]|nr:uracil-DNA glycosylase [Coprobacillus sp.]
MSKDIDTWNEFFVELRRETFCVSLNEYLNKEYQEHTCLPKRENLFNAFKLTPLDKVKVVIIGQDPYINENQAMGLAFSVPKGVELPPSLVNIYKEIEKEMCMEMDYTNGDLTYLAKQGVLLLNTILSVRKGESMSHNIPEYQQFTARVMQLLDKQDRPMVFLLWGSYAKKLEKYITNPLHKILTAHHPSPLSANFGGWFGCNNFMNCNAFLTSHGEKAIMWCNKPLGHH